VNDFHGDELARRNLNPAMQSTQGGSSARSQKVVVAGDGTALQIRRPLHRAAREPDLIAT
jgi:hypothetical protein